MDWKNRGQDNSGRDLIWEFHRARMRKIDDDHRAAMRRINRDSRIMYWILGIFMAVAALGPLVVALIQR